MDISLTSIGLWTLYLVCVVGVLLFVCFLLYTGYLCYVHWKYSHLPQPKRPSFYLGHLLDVLRYIKESENEEISIGDVWHKWSLQVGQPIFVTFTFHTPSVFTTDPESVKTIIMNPRHGKDVKFTKTFVNLMGERYIGQSLFAITDSRTWKPRRQIYDPAFKKSHLKTLLEPFNKKADEFIEILWPMADGKTEVPMKTHFADFTLETISKVAFGTDFSRKSCGKEDGYSDVKIPNTSLIHLVQFTFKGLGMVFRNPLYQYVHPLEAAKYRQASRDLRALGRDCITKRIQLIESGGKTSNDILTHILRLASTRESVNIEELVDDFVGFYIGGQDTTQNLLAFSLALTLLDPNVLERVQAEIDEVLGSKDHVDYEDLEKLQYIEQVFKETLRLYPAVIGLNKQVAPGGVVLNGYEIPAGTRLVLPVSLMGRLPEYFDDPDTFNPGRFDPDKKKPSSFVYFPFGVGHRSCIGKHFAMMEAKILFSRLFQTYRIKLPENYKLVAVMRGTIQPKDNVPCYLERQ